MKIGVIGAGRLGICFALLLEKSGYDVIVSDCRHDYVNDLNNRIINSNEPYVAELLSESKNFKAVTDNVEVIKECSIVYTLVSTPSLPSGKYDVSSVWEVIKDFQNCNFPINGKTFVIGCTTNPGDCDDFQSQLNAYGVDVFYNPEFIAQGSIIKDLQYADIVLIGGEEGSKLDSIKEIYYKIQLNTPNIFTMAAKSGEITKIAINCFLTSKISFANTIGQVMCLSGLGSEVGKVLDAIGSDSRIGNKYLRYGFGFGGPCFPRDNRSFASYAESVGCEFNVGRTTDNFNKKHLEFLKNYFISKNTDNDHAYYFDYISYKKGTDILTESHQYDLCLALLNAGFTVYVNDVEEVINQVKDSLQTQFFGKVNFIENEDELPEKIIPIKF